MTYDSAVKAAAKLVASAKANPRLIAEPAPAQQMQLVLPGWDDEQRGMPNALLRSSLFRATHPNLPRITLKKHTISTPNGIEIVQTSTEDLRQAEADVMFELLHLARNRPSTDKFHFTGYAMLKRLGWSKSGYVRLREAIERLQTTSIHVKWTTGKRREGFQGSLVRAFAWRDEDVMAAGGPKRHWIIYLEPQIIKLFSGDDYTRVSIQQRRLLKHELSKWLHSFYHSHEAPYPYSVESLRDLSGSRTEELFNFRKIVVKALEDLKRIGALSKGFIDEHDNVNVVRGTMEVLPAEEPQPQLELTT